MEISVLEESKEFLRTYLKWKSCEYETLHPWRKDSLHIVLHSFRVYSMAMKIAEGERNRLSDEDILLIQLSAILHDIGKCETKEGHAERGAEIVGEWLRGNPSVAMKIPDVERLLTIIRNHSNKEEFEKDLCLAIIKDSDLLDEIGALSIFMASNQIDRYDPYFFNELNQRLQVFELDYCDEQMKKLNTVAGKIILQNKIQFIKEFINQLGDELDGTHELYNEFKVQ